LESCALTSFCFRQIGFGFIADDRNQVAHREIGVDQMQTQSCSTWPFTTTSRYVIGVRRPQLDERSLQIGTVLIATQAALNKPGTLTKDVSMGLAG